MMRSKKTIALAATMLSVVMLLSAGQDNSTDTRHAAAPTPDTTWTRLAGGDTLHTAEQAYRACAREATLRRLPVKEFPDTSERIAYVTENGKRLKRSEHTAIAIDDMQVDNGCATRIVRFVSVEILSDDLRANATPDETGYSPRLTATETGPGIRLALNRTTLPRPTCALKRDVGVQSHFMMLNLCWHEERRAEEARLKGSTPLQKKTTNTRASG